MPPKWVLEMRSAYSHGVQVIKSLNTTIQHVINAKTYHVSSVKASPEHRATTQDARIQQLLSEAKRELSGSRTDIISIVKKMGTELASEPMIDYPSFPADHQKHITDLMSPLSSSDTTSKKGSWVAELSAAYKASVVAVSLIKERAIPNLEQVRSEVMGVNLHVYGTTAQERVRAMQIHDTAFDIIRELKDAQSRLSVVTKKIATELKKHNIKDFDKTHDYNLRHYLA